MPVKAAHDPTVVAAALLHDFAYAVKGQLACVTIRQLRVQELAAFLGDGLVAAHRSLADKVTFLETRGYARAEIVDALSEVHADADAMRLLEAGAGPLLDVGAQSTASTATSSPGGAASGGGAAAAGGHSPGAAAAGGLLWRVGSIVYAYHGRHEYYPVPLLGIDHSRCEDIFRVAHQLPSGEYGTPTHYASGFKGVVPDELVPWHLVRTGWVVLALKADDCYRGHLKEGLVLAVSQPTVDGFYTIDVEWCHDASCGLGIASQDVRLLQHPRLVAEETEREAENNRKQQLGAAERISSGTSYPVGVAGPAAAGAKGQAASSNVESAGDLPLLTASIRNFLHYPDVDVYEQPRGIRTGASFVSQYGEPLATHSQGTAPPPPPPKSSDDDLGQSGRFTSDFKGAPVLPPSQAAFVQSLLSGSPLGAQQGEGEASISRSTATTAAFGYNLSDVGRHPRSPLHMTHNPVVAIARQCVARATMFVDPEFPPSFCSLAGYEAAQKEAKAIANAAFTGPVTPHAMRTQVVWRRISEVFFRPRLFAVGSKPSTIVPGRFTPPWMVSLSIALMEAQEFEDMCSPADDGWVYGAYVLRLFLEGRWYFVTLDDMIPCDAKTGAPLTCVAGAQSEIYPILLEKALAKLCGSYADLAYSSHPNGALTLSLPRCWEAVTSNVTDLLDHRFLKSRDDATTNLHSMLVEERCVSAIHAVVRNLESTPDGMRFMGCGFTPGATWHVADITSLAAQSRGSGSGVVDKVYLFHVVRGDRDGPEVPRLRALREQLLDAAEVNAAELLGFGADADAGTVSYWLTADDYFAAFAVTYCLRYANNCQKAVYRGSYAHRQGFGPKVRGPQAFLSNPQVLLSLVQPSDVTVEVLLSDPRCPPVTGRASASPLLQARRLGGATSLQVHLLRGNAIGAPIDPSEPLPALMATSIEVNLADDDDCIRFPVVCARASLPAGGNYVLVPTISCAAGSVTCDVDFVLKVTSVSAFYLKPLLSRSR